MNMSSSLVPSLNICKDFEHINKVLHDSYQALKYETVLNPSLLGASVYGLDEIHTKLRDYKFKQQQTQENKNNKYYIVVMDIKGCFNSINQTKLMQFVETKFLTCKEYGIQRHYTSYPHTSMELIRTKSRKITRNSATSLIYPPIKPLALIPPTTATATATTSTSETNSSSNKRNSISTYGVLEKFVLANKVKFLIKSLIGHNIISFNNKYHLQTKGIPQGSILSTLLCNLYYAQFEKQNLKFIVDGLVMRLVDDYILVTTSKLEAETFAGLLNQGVPEWGIEISKNKTKTNILEETEWLAYCGMFLSTSTLETRIDLSKMLLNNIYTSFQMDPLLGKTLRCGFNIKCHAIFVDSSLNSVSTM